MMWVHPSYAPCRAYLAVEGSRKFVYRAVQCLRRHRMGLAALQTYIICQQLVRQKENAALLPHVQGMKRLNKFGKKHAKTPGEPAPPLAIA